MHRLQVFDPKDTYILLNTTFFKKFMDSNWIEYEVDPIPDSPP